MVKYFSLGLVRKASPDEVLKQTCKDCPQYQTKKTGMMKVNGLNAREAYEWLRKAITEPLLSISLGPLGRMISHELRDENSTRPFYGDDAESLARHVSETQAKQQMNTCKACASFICQTLKEMDEENEPVLIV